MKIFVLLSFVAFTLAEPPVSDSYAPARSNDNIEIQRSLSFEYGTPEFNSLSPSSFRSPSSTYGAPETRGFGSKAGYQKSRTLSQEYGTPNTRSTLSQSYGVPNTRNAISQEYGLPSARNTLSQQYGPPARNSLSEEYGVPSARSLSQQYGPPSARNTLSEEYGAPNVRTISQNYGAPARSLSQTYGTPNTRNSLSQEYGVPSARGSLSQEYGHPVQSYASSRGLSQQYGVPQSRANSYSSARLSDSYGAPLQSDAPIFDPVPSEEYGVPSSFGAQSLSSFNAISDDYSVPPKPVFNARASSYSKSTSGTSRALSTRYGAANARSSYSNTLRSSPKISDSYTAPKSLSAQYGAPEARADLKTNAYASGFGVGRSSPSQNYGPPSRSAMPSEQYGVPDLYNSLSNQGYSYARNALDELLNQEPANYDFGYKVNDYQSGSDFGHTETRQENKAEGSYFVVLPDGTKQIVEYEADERGFKPRISVEPAAGYDENAADLARSGDGPY